jgi:hypothetical protein
MTSLLPGSGEQKLTPQAILDMNYAFARAATLVASVRLHLFTHLANQALTPVELAACADTVPEPTERLLQGLALLGLVEREGNAYRLTPMADHFLVEGKPCYLGGDTLAMIDYVPAWFELDICDHICRFTGDERTRTLLNKLAQSLHPGGPITIAAFDVINCLSPPYRPYIRISPI